MHEDILNFVAPHLDSKVSPQDISITKLFGQASYREYYRITTPSSLLPRPSSLVLMKLPNGFASPAEEVTKIGEGASKELPFLNVQKYLNTLEIPVPQVLATDEQNGLILLEDLGDTSLEILYRNAGSEFGLVYYKKVVELLIDLQTKTQQNGFGPCVASFRKFDVELLNWEFNHFLEYGIEDRLGITLEENEKRVFRETTAHISSIIAHMPQGFVHRDYQSRNLMFHNMNFTLIDFQDALTGPVLYDLVALLRDSYVCFTPEQTMGLLSHYQQNLPAEHPYHDKWNALLSDFYLITIQRKLKDAGRFQFINTVKKNPGFLPNIPRSLEYVRQALETLREMKYDCAELSGFLKKHLENF